MGQPAAKLGDQITAVDTHEVLVETESGEDYRPLPHPFTGIITGGSSSDVMIMGRPAAVQGSTGDNVPPHLPTEPGEEFERPPTNKATVQSGSPTVMINGRPAARAGDVALTCNDPSDAPVGTVVAVGTVMIG